MWFLFCQAQSFSELARMNSVQISDTLSELGAVFQVGMSFVPKVQTQSIWMNHQAEEAAELTSSSPTTVRTGSETFPSLQIMWKAKATDLFFLKVKGEHGDLKTAGFVHSQKDWRKKDSHVVVIGVHLTRKQGE
jgi:hypothetical protein